MQQIRPGNFQILPVLIKNLLIINSLVFLAQLTIDGILPGGDLQTKVGFVADTFALHHIFSPLFKPWQLLTHMFMHGSLMHLFSNMFALWMFGSILENLWGPKRFLIFYLVCGVGAAILHLGFLWYENYQLMHDFEAFRNHPTLEAYTKYFNHYNLGTLDYGTRENYPTAVLNAWQSAPDNYQIADQAVMLVTDHANYSLSEPTLGASGAVFGCLAAFGYLFPNTYIYLYFFVPIKAKWFVLLYIAFELSMAVRNSAGDNVARWAHLGGALVGVLLVYFWNKNNRRHFY
ncbi:MAG TPA: rhomboid family intramembrane serine protease [Phnomibacter sp.]|nr:rhomboid family intramembrane serine protease [Phnomibacter sp.]